ELVGGGGLHRRVGVEALEIGYWIRASRIRQGFATEAAGALTRGAFERCGGIRTEIHVDPADAPSLGVAGRPGHGREGVLRKRLPPVRPGSGRRDEVVSSLLEDEYAGSRAASVWVEGLG